jgi:cobalt/nickel transport system permease protein
MGILGAFIFAAQMINFQIPAMPGTSGHMVGAVLLAIILGPHAGAIVISSVVIIQCLIFQDGGLLALGCNIINIAIVPSYLGHFIYKSVTGNSAKSLRIYIASLLACLIATEISAALIPIQAAVSGVLAVPFQTFLITMLGVYLLVALIEGLVTVAVLAYIQQVRCDIVADVLPGKIRLSKKALLTTLAIFTVIIAGGLSLLASALPDGLEYSYAQSADAPNDDPTIKAVDEFQDKYSPLPNYSKRTSTKQDTANWTSFAGVVGAAITMTMIWLTAKLIRTKNSKLKTQN